MLWTTGAPTVRFGTKCLDRLVHGTLALPVHDVDVEPVGTILYHPRALPVQLGKVARQQ